MSRLAFGERFKQVIAEHYNGSQAIAAQRLEISESLVSRIVHGKQLPGRAVIARIAEQTTADLRWLLIGKYSDTSTR
jgi:transcriptional regulator with XRE-family HTH domain